MKLEFNYLLVLGSSGTGKTTLAKTVAKDLKSEAYKILVFDPNRQWADLCDQEVGPEELAWGLTRIAKPLLWERKVGVLVVEDLGFTLQQIQVALKVSLSKAKNMLRLILENARKYGLKVIFVSHRLASDEIDTVMFQQFDAYALFNVPLTAYGERLVKQRLGIDKETIWELQPYHFIMYNGGHLSRGSCGSSGKSPKA